MSSGAGALKAGDVYVVVTASIGDFVQSMKDVVKEVEKSAKRVEQLGNKMGEIGAIIGAGLAGAIAASAQFSDKLTGELERVKLVFLNVAASLTEALLPHLKSLADTLTRLLGAFQQLSPAARELAAGFLFYGAAVGLAGGAVGKTAGLVATLAASFNDYVVPAVDKGGNALVAFSARMRGIDADDLSKKLKKSADDIDKGFAKTFRNMAMRIALVGAPLLAVAAAVAALVLLAGTLYKAWNDSSTGMRTGLQSLWESIKSGALVVGRVLGDVFTGVGNFILGFVVGVLDIFAVMIRGLAKLAAPLARLLKQEDMAKGLEGLQNVTGEKLGGAALEGMKSAFEDVKKAFTSIWEGVKDGAAYAFDGVKDMGTDVAAYLKGQFAGLFDKAGKVKDPKFEPIDTSSGAFTQASMAPRQFNDLSTLAPARQFEELGPIVAEQARLAMEAARSRTASSIAGSFASAFGDVGNIIRRAAQAAQGGPMAAIASVIADLLLRSETFATIVTMVTNFVQFLADTVGMVLAPVLPVLGSIFTMVASLLQPLTPVLTMLLQPLTLLTPIFDVLGQLLGALAPVIAMVAMGFTLVYQPWRLLAGPIMKGLFEVVKLLAAGIIWVVKGIAGIWNGIVGAVQGLFRMLANLDIFGAKPLDFLNGWADGLNSARIDIDSLSDAMAQLSNTTWEQSQAAGAAAAAQWSAAGAAKEVAESLTNVPQGFKLNLARFNAQDALPSSGALPTAIATGGLPFAGASAPPVVDNSQTTNNLYVYGAEMTQDELVDAIQNKLDSMQQRRTGSRARGSGRFD